MENFNSLGLSEPLLQSLERLKFTEPTPIQAQTIPLAIAGKDILGSAQTGTGKTAAFGIPLVEKLLANPTGSALVLTPTRELASQVMQALQGLLDKQWRNKTALLIGGEAIFKQLQKLRGRPRLIVGTPGRINDHLKRGSLKLRDTNFLVLDETDRMLDMGFLEQIDDILAHMPQKRQTLLFSATLPKNIVKIAEKYLNKPERVAIGESFVPVAKIKQEVLFVADKEKYQKFLDELAQREGSVIVFVKTKMGADRMAGRLRKENHQADAIHGDLRHNKRESVIRSFRNSKFRIMVATDVAARGLDIPHIEHVINYDLPQCPEDYIHRIGRTSRAGRSGSALCFVTPTDRGKWQAIKRLIDPNAKDDFPERPYKGNSKKSNSSGKKPYKYNSKKPGGGYGAGAGGSQKRYKKPGAGADNGDADSAGGQHRYKKSEDGQQRYKKSEDGQQRYKKPEDGQKRYKKPEGGQKRYKKSSAGGYKKAA